MISMGPGTPMTAEFVIDAYHRPFEIEKSFRGSRGLVPRPAGAGSKSTASIPASSSTD
jgi:hypothetical protein